jgi:hypothetical protein
MLSGQMRLLVLGLGAVLCWSEFAAAQTSDAARAAARELATEGVHSYESADYKTAVNKLNRAFEAYRAPSIGLWSARALAGHGRLVQASERYLEVTRIDPKTGDEAVQRQAQADAAKEHEALQPRIPTLTLQLVRPHSVEPLRVTLDGVAIPGSLVEARVPADPGDHTIEVEQGELRGVAFVKLAEGQHQVVSISLRRKANAQDPPRTDPGTPALAPSRSSTVSDEPPGRRRLPTTFWVAVGASGVGLVVGGVTGVMAKSKYDELSPTCPDDVCAPRDADGVDQLATLRTVSTAGFVVGGVGLAAAGFLWFTAPKQPANAYVRPALGPGSVGVRGVF